MQKIKASLLLVAAIVVILSTVTAADFTKVVNIFQEKATVIPGDVIQCEITKTELEETSDNYDVFTQACGTEECYAYHSVSEKCFSFKLKTLKAGQIIFGNTRLVSPGNVEIVLEWDNDRTVIREIDPNNTKNTLTKIHISGVVNDKEYSGFWVRWLDDKLFEIGRESETTSFLHYRFDRKLEINYIGIMTWRVEGAWIIDSVPKCPGSNQTEVQKKLKAESDCIILK